MSKKRRINHQRAARATLDLFLSQGVGMFFLLLASRSACYSDAREASNALHRLIGERVRAYLAQLLAASDMDGEVRDGVIAARTPVVTARVIARLPRCASRSQGDFARWMERQIADAAEEDDGDPNDGPGAPSPMMAVSESWALHTLPIPRVERDALVAAVMAELTQAERDILRAMEDPHASWSDTAEAFGLTMFEAKQLHQRADVRAHTLAVRIATRAVGITGVRRAKKAA
jgi:hypothetical protein